MQAGEAELTEFRRHTVGFVFQFYNLIPSLTARENVAIVPDIARDPMTPEETLSLVGLSERLDHFPARLQRVEIGKRGGRFAQVFGGLHAGDEVIVHPG